MLSKVRYIAEYLPFFLVSRGLALLPFNMAVGTGILLGRLIYIFDARHRRVAADNISAVLGLDRQQSLLMARKVFENLGRTFAEFLHIDRIDPWLTDNLDVEGIENYHDAKKEGKGVLFLSAHLGNWETLGVANIDKTGEIMNVIYRQAKNPYVNYFIDSLRRSRGFHMISHRNSVKDILAALRRRESVGILLDQVPRPKESVLVDFMSRPAQTNIGLALIAIKTGAPVVPIFFVRKDGRYRLVYENPIIGVRTGDFESDIRETTMRFNDVIERYVRQYPEQWFWVHDRWKISRKFKKMEKRREADER